jgi:5S rRNA maturation endonuclease (ribonuclease M5)
MIRQLLERNGIEVRNGSKEGEIKICCLFCTDQSSSYSVDTKYRLGINEYTGQAHCFHCNWSMSSSVYMLAKVLSTKLEDTLSFADIKESRTPPKPIVKKVVLASAIPEDYEQFYFPQSQMDPVELEAVRYLYGRGITTQQIVEHKIGYCMFGKYRGRIVFPVENELGKVTGCVCRDFTGKAELKYLNTDGTKGIYGIRTTKKKAVIVEGVLDKLHCDEFLERTPYAVIAILGSNITDDQIALLKRFDETVHLPDADDAGLKGAIYLGDALSPHLNHHVVLPFKLDQRDPGKMSSHEVLNSLGRKMFYDKSAKLKLKAKIAFK